MVDSDNKTNKSRFTLDWLVGGALTRIGDTLDRMTGRGWNPSSSLATSKLSEKLCFLLDEEAKEGEFGGKFAPHIITLKMQWNKFSADSEQDLVKLRDELHTVAINHINDKLYHTYAPIELEIKTDYFTEGVRITGGFGTFGDEEEAAVNVTLPDIKVERSSEGSRASINLSEDDFVEQPAKPVYRLRFEVNGKSVEKKLDFAQTKRFTVGRGKESGVSIEHPSVSKVHASLVLNDEGRLLVADTGSTNGTYVNDRRIAYGKAVEIGSGEDLKFGAVPIEIEHPEPMSHKDMAHETEVIADPSKRVLPPTVALEADSAGLTNAKPEPVESPKSDRLAQTEIIDAGEENAEPANAPETREDWEV